MTPIPRSPIASARSFLAEGWRPAAEPGQLTPPVGEQRGDLFLVDDWTWQAMAMMQLAADPGKVRG